MWLKRRQLGSAFTLLHCVAWVQVCEESLALHRYVVGTGQSTSKAFSDNGAYSFFFPDNVCVLTNMWRYTHLPDVNTLHYVFF